MSSVLHDRILELHDQFTESERRLAEVTLACLANLATYTGSELAERAGVSKATASRFFRRLGYENFNEIRALIREQGEHGSPLHELTSTSTQGKSRGKTDDALARHVANDLQNLSRTFEQLDPADVKRTVTLFAKSRRICVAGFRNGRVLAQYAWALLCSCAAASPWCRAPA